MLLAIGVAGDETITHEKILMKPDRATSQKKKKPHFLCLQNRAIPRDQQNSFLCPGECIIRTYRQDYLKWKYGWKVGFWEMFQQW